jgi:hypothetical protein
MTDISVLNLNNISTEKILRYAINFHIVKEETCLECYCFSFGNLIAYSELPCKRGNAIFNCLFLWNKVI